jgi:UDP-glucose 4-epimerase
MARVLVTGASGFVGSCLVRRLLRDGHEVHVLLQPEHQGWRLQEVRREIVVHAASLEDEAGVLRCMREVRPNWVFHLAAYGAYSQQADVSKIYRTNVLGTVHLVQAALASEVQVVVNTGSSSEYGFKDHAPSEDEVVEPNSDYAVSKVSATLFCQFTARKYATRIPTLRLYSVYGPYEEPSRFVATLVAKGLRGELPPLVDGKIARDFVFVDDVCDAYVTVAKAQGEEPAAIYNVGSGRQTTIADAVAVARELFAIADEPRWGAFEKRSWDTSIWVADPRKMQRELGWKATTTLRDGLARTAEWLKSRAPR